MNTNNPNRPSEPVVEQTVNNSTSWIGHSINNPVDISKGQTFEATSEGNLDDVQIFSNIVTAPGDVVMTLHSFDPQENVWSNPIASSTVPMKTTDTGRWMSFPLAGMHLQKGRSYGFRISSSHSLVGLGEAVCSAKNPPVIKGQEWQFTNGDSRGQSFSYFTLTYRLGLRA